MFAGAPANLPAGCHERRETAMPNEERESAIAMGLARRTYLYRLFHVVFGSRPTGEGVAKVLGGETPALLGSVGEALEIGRAHV